ncbi:MAG TPA: hypothetical protein V6C65_12070, partial [Allocoleopsis sp.]
TDGLILSIKMGPAGFRDENLKLFVNKMRKAGYDLYDNPIAPGWNWTWNTTAEGYDLEDSDSLRISIGEIPDIQCPVSSGSKETDCPPSDAMQENYPIGFEPIPFTGNESHHSINYSIVPNPVSGNTISFKLPSPGTEMVTWRIIDAYGHQRQAGSVPTGDVNNIVRAGVSNLEPGIYTVISDYQGQIGRFIKI